MIEITRGKVSFKENIYEFYKEMFPIIDKEKDFF